MLVLQLVCPSDAFMSRRKGNSNGWRQLWLSNLVNGCALIMKASGSPMSEAFFVLGSHFGSIVAGWPAKPLDGQGNLFALRTDVRYDEVRWVVVDDDALWDASPVRWYAPLTCSLHDVPHRAIVAFARGWGSLLEASGRQCFGSMTFTQLGLLATGVLGCIRHGKILSSSLPRHGVQG